MSDPAAPAAAPTPDTTPTPAPAAPTPVVEIDIPADGGFPADSAPDPAPVASDPAAAAADPASDPKPLKKSAFQTRIDTVTAQREAEKRRADEAEKRAALFEAMAAGKPPVADPNADPAAPAPSPTVGLIPGTPEFQKAVRAEAIQLAAQETAKSRMDGLLKAGRTEFKDFDDRCNTIASLGAGDRGDFMQIMTDPSIIPDGQKVIAQLADNPDEATRILAMDTVPMTAALVKFQAEMSKPAPPKPISGAPPPIKPIDGTARTDTEPKDSDDMATYAAKYRTIQAKRLQEKAPSRFARH